MALMNFIKPGTYTYIDNVSFSKHNKMVQFILAVKEKNEMLFNIPMNITANNEAVVINRIVTTAKEMTDMAPEFVNIKEGENYLIKMIDPNTDYLFDVNFRVISKVKNRVAVCIPTYYYIPSTKETYKLNEVTGYALLPKYKIETVQQFDDYFNNSELMPSLYRYIKSMPVFSNCIDA